MITTNDIIKGAKFQIGTGDIFEIVEVIPNYYKELTGVKSKRGTSEYTDELNEAVDFLNEEKAVKI